MIVSLKKLKKRKSMRKCCLYKALSLWSTLLNSLYLSLTTIISMNRSLAVEILFSGNFMSIFHIIYRQGYPVDGFHLIQKGEFEVIKRIWTDEDDNITKLAKFTIKKKQYIDVRVMVLGTDNYFGLYQCLDEQNKHISYA